MTDRDYLRSLGFTVGERGRFSKDMVEALSNRDKNDTDDEMNGIRESLKLPPQIQQRDAQELWGLTRAGSKLAFITCASCSNHMIWCECDKILAPDNVATLMGAAKGIAKIHPRMVQLVSTHN